MALAAQGNLDGRASRRFYQTIENLIQSYCVWAKLFGVLHSETLYTITES